MSLPKYICHKTVNAAKIIGLYTTDDKVHLELEDFGWTEETYDYFDKHNPYPGGYYVVYEDGYSSFSPPGAFEQGYTKVKE